MLRLSATAVFAAVLASSASGSQTTSTAPHVFSVRDSIEMLTFSDPFTRDPLAVSRLSPDRKHFLVITTKGLLEPNQLQSEMWIYDSDQVVAYLHGGQSAPRAKRLLEIEATPRARQLDSYGSLITEARWSSDSSAILFLGETGDGIRRLYRVRLEAGVQQLLSDQRQDVVDFDESEGTIAYAAQEDDSEGEAGLDAQLHGISVDLSGLTLSQILHPHRSPPNSYPLDRPIDAWVVRVGPHAVPDPIRLSNRWHLPVSAVGARFHLAVSPDGHYLVAARPVEEIPSSWSNYRSARKVFRFDELPAKWNPTLGPWDWPWQYILVDLERKTVSPLVDSPSAAKAGYGEPFHIAWSKDGKRILFTSTFLPLDGISSIERLQRERPCAAAVFNVANRETSCIAFSSLPAADHRLISASIGDKGTEVAITWRTSLGRKEEQYEERGGQWNLKQGISLESGPSGITLTIRQDLNEPPILWANDLTTGVSKSLWDPNPQIGSLQLGEASVYRWMDDTGYEWKAALLRPPGFVRGLRYPLVIYTHGFQNDHEFLADGAFTTGFAARALAAGGIVVLQMEDRRDRYTRPMADEAISEVEGFRSAVRHLSKDGIVDPDKVGVAGFSRTSWYAETALVEQPDLFKAASIMDGADESYMQYMLFCPFDFECRVEGDTLHGGPPVGKHLADWLTSSVSFHLDQVRAAVRLEAIGLASVLGEWEIYSSMTQLGKPVDLIYIPNGQHILQSPQERFASQEGNVDWFRFWLEGYEDPNPAKSAQYSRWRALRSLTERKASRDEKKRTFEPQK